MVRYTYLQYLFIILFLTGLFACKSKKGIIQSSEKKTITNIIDNVQLYDWYEAKAKIKFNSSEENFSGILNARIRHDSAFLVAIKKLGVEGVRTLVTQDTITYIDRINHQYYIKDITQLKIQNVSMTYSYAQLLLSGSQPLFNREEIIDSLYTEDNIIIKTIVNDIIHELTYNIYTGYLEKVHFTDDYSISGQYSYSDYRIVEGNIVFPYHRKYAFDVGATKMLTLELDFSKISINQAKSIKINIPNSYNEVNY